LGAKRWAPTHYSNRRFLNIDTKVKEGLVGGGEMREEGRANGGGAEKQKRPHKPTTTPSGRTDSGRKNGQ